MKTRNLMNSGITLKYLLIQPFAFLHLRYIQWKYKWMTLRNYRNQTNYVTTKLRLLQAIEEYYKGCYEPYGIFHPSCAYGEKHTKRMEWLFPPKNFKEFVDIKWYSEEAVDFYRRVIVWNGIPMPEWNDAWNKNGRNSIGRYDFSVFKFEHHHKYKLDYTEILKRKNKETFKRK